MDLAGELLKRLEDLDLSESYMMDDFYDELGIPKKDRSDFVTAIIFKQVLERRDIKDLPPINPVLLRNVEKGKDMVNNMIELVKRLQERCYPGFTKSTKKGG